MSMLSLVRLRAPLALRLPLSVRPTFPSSIAALVGLRRRALSTEAPAAVSSKRGPRFMICPNCRREGHLRKDCKEPTICVACGLEGHQRKNCPSPDPARLEALKTAPVKCFRCGENHTLKECPQPPKCFECGQPGHGRKDCPAFLAKLAATKAAKAAEAAKAAAQPVAA